MNIVRSTRVRKDTFTNMVRNIIVNASRIERVRLTVFTLINVRVIVIYIYIYMLMFVGMNELR